MSRLAARAMFLLMGFILCLSVPQAGLVQANGPISANWILGDAPAVEGEPGQWTVGDRIPLRLDLSYPAEARLALPQFPKAWGDLEVYQTGELETVSKEAGIVRAVLDMWVIAWAPGQWQTPAIAIEVTDQSQATQWVQVQPITIEIGSVLPQTAEGESLEKEDLKPQAEMPLPPWWLLALLGIALAVALYLGLRWAINRWRKRRQNQIEEPAMPTVDMRPAHVIALAELERIAALRLPQQGAFKAHYTLLTDCLRAYLERRYGMSAMERTTTEIAGILLTSPIEPESRVRLVQLLMSADLIKFAEVPCKISEANASLAEAGQIVELTKPQPYTIPEDEAEPALRRASRTEVE